MHQILIVEDDQEIAVGSQKYLQSKGLSVLVAENAGTAKKLLFKTLFTCIVLDILLPDGNGMELCKTIRQTSNTPILFLSCLDEQQDVIRGLVCGGDDYMTKPFSLQELEARIRVLIRRSTAYSFRLDKENHSLLTPVGTILFSGQEFGLLELLLEHKDTVTEQMFLRRFPSESNAFAVYIRRLRKKLEAIEPWIGQIETVYGQGYRLNQKVPIA